MLTRYYQYFRWLSLDVVLGADLFLAFLNKIYQVESSFHVYLALSIAIWLIYTCDHLVDVASATQLSARRRFHRSNFSLLILIAGSTLVIGLINIHFLSVELIKAGALLASGCVTYLMVVYFYKSIWFKEALIAIGYSIGIFLSPLVSKGEISLLDVILVVQLGLLALSNLLIFSYFEKIEDQKNGFVSMVIKMQENASVVIRSLLGLIIASTISLTYIMPEAYLSVQMVYLFMALILMMVISFHRYFGSNERFRAVGDAIFYLPIIFLL